MNLDFSAISQKQQSTEHVSVLRHNTLTSSQPVFVLFLYLIFRDKQTLFLFVYICIVVTDPIIKKAEGCDPILQITA